MSRINKDEYYLEIAKSVSKRSTCLRRRYGCVIVNNDEIIATGYNGAPRNKPNCCDIYKECPRKDKEHNSGDYSDCGSVHAEQNAMLSASRKDMIGATMYLYGQEKRVFTDLYTYFIWESLDECMPCPICERMIVNSGIKRVVSENGEIRYDN